MKRNVRSRGGRSPWQLVHWAVLAFGFTAFSLLTKYRSDFDEASVKPPSSRRGAVHAVLLVGLSQYTSRRFCDIENVGSPTQGNPRLKCCHG